MFTVTPKTKSLVQCEHGIVLTESQFAKLQKSSSLYNRIIAMCNDMQIDHRISENSNIRVSYASRVVSAVDDTNLHELEMAHINFLSEVDKMELPEEEKQDMSLTGEEVDFISRILEEYDSESKIYGARVLIACEENPHAIITAGISSKTLRKILFLALSATLQDSITDATK